MLDIVPVALVVAITVPRTEHLFTAAEVITVVDMAATTANLRTITMADTAVTMVTADMDTTVDTAVTTVTVDMDTTVLVLEFTLVGSEFTFAKTSPNESLKTSRTTDRSRSFLFVLFTNSVATAAWCFDGQLVTGFDFEMNAAADIFAFP